MKSALLERAWVVVLKRTELDYKVSKERVAVRLDEEGMCGRTVEAIEQPLAAFAF